MATKIQFKNLSREPDFMPLLCADMYFSCCFISLSSIKTKCLELKDISYLSFVSLVPSARDTQASRVGGLLTDTISREWVLNTSLKWLCKQTAAAPNPGDYIQGKYRSIKPLGHQHPPCPNTSFFILNFRASLTLLSQPIRRASVPPNTLLP